VTLLDYVKLDSYEKIVDVTDSFQLSQACQLMSDSCNTTV